MAGSCGCRRGALGRMPKSERQDPTNEPLVVCYYDKARRLEAVAEELMSDPRAEDDQGILETVAHLLSIVADIKDDNPVCWERGGRCPRCPRPEGQMPGATHLTVAR